MKGRFFILLALLPLSACQTKPKETVPQKDYSNVPPLFSVHGPEIDPKIEKYPVAEPVEGRPGFVRSPYTGRVVDARRVRSGGLAKDPSITTDPHYFRLR